MKYNSRRQLLLLAISIALLGQSSFGQTRRPAVSKPPARVVAKEPVPTFDTLLAADRYKVYSEVRSVGQLLSSNSLNDLMNPLMQLSAPPKEFQAITKWLKAHADELMTSRMMVA